MRCPLLEERVLKSMPSADRQISVKIDEETANQLGRLTVELDVTASRIIRTCLLLGIPMLKANKCLVGIDNIALYQRGQSLKGDELV